MSNQDPVSYFIRALAIYEEQLGATHPYTAQSLNNLAALYQSQERYGEAEPLLRRALSIYEEQSGSVHPDTASSLNNLALPYDVQGSYGEAEPLLGRALSIYEEQWGPTGLITAAIIVALSAGTGAVDDLTEASKTAITDAYSRLKNLLTKKFGDKSDVAQAVSLLERRPESFVRKEVLAEEMAAVQMEQDEEMLAAARQVLTLVQPQQGSLGKFTIQNNAVVQGQNIGDYQQITQQFGHPPKDSGK